MAHWRLRSACALSAWLGGVFVLLCTSPGFGQDLYWTELKAMCKGSVVRHSQVGSTATDDPVSSADFAIKVVLDQGARRIYWSEGKTIRRANIDSAGTADIVTVANPFLLKGFTLDLKSGKILWLEGVSGSPCVNPNCPRVRRANLDGSDVETLFTVPGAKANVGDIAVDSAAGKVYWSDLQYSPYISRANFDGSSVEPLVTVAVAPAVAGVPSIEIDPAAGKLYWIDASGFIPGDSRVRRGNLDGTSAEDLVSYISSTPRPQYLSLDSSCGWLYFTFSGFCPDGTGSILRINLATKAQETLFMGIGIADGIAVNAGADRDKDGTPDCNDGCPDDPNKASPGTCGCGVAEADSNGDGMVDCPAGSTAACCAPGTATMLAVAPLLFIGWKRRTRHRHP